MAHPVIATKLYAPKACRDFVSGLRLSQRLQEGAGATLTLLSAPAGFGKSTLLGQWFREAAPEGRAVAWVSLDSTDSVPHVFWSYVLRALQDATDGRAARTSAMHAATPTLPTETLLTEMVNELSSSTEDVWLVLDDYHVIDSPEVHAAMGFLVDHLPDALHIVVSTRADPDLPLARLRARGQLVEIRAADLRFDTTEAATYFSNPSGAQLTNEQVVALQERTEGWIAALQLASLSLRSSEDIDGFVTRFAGNDRFVVDYLVEEVLEQQADLVREFLLTTSVLDRLSGSLCDEVTGRADSSDMLLILERANLFVIALDDRREWYRYHHLFADVLRSRLLHEQAALLPQLHQRASNWHAEHDLEVEAIRHALAARDFDRPAHLMELAVPAMRRDRQDAAMHGWLRALPDDVIRQRPVLSVFAGGMSLASGDLSGLEERLDDAERTLANGPVASAHPWADSSELCTLPATIAVHRASLAQARADTSGTATYAQQALRLAGPEDHLARAGAAGFLAFAAWTAGDIAGALESFTATLQSLRAAGNLVDELNGAVILADLHVAAGRPCTAGSLVRRALKRAEEGGARTAAVEAGLHVVLSELDDELGDWHSAEMQLAAASAFYDQSPGTQPGTRWLAARARLASPVGLCEAAGILLDKAEQSHQPTIFPDVRPVAPVRARGWIAEGDLHQASDWARSTGLSLADEPSYLREFEHLTLVRLTLAQHQHRQRSAPDAELAAVKVFLGRLAVSAAAGGRAGSAFETGLMLALTHEAAGQRQPGVDTLGVALTAVPEPDGYARLLLDEKPAMLGLLRDAQEQGLAGDHAKRLLDLTRSAPASYSRASGLAAAWKGQPLTDRELQVLRLLDSDLSGPQIADVLFVSQNTLRTHTRHIFTKLDVTTRRAAVSRARESRLR